MEKRTKAHRIGFIGSNGRKHAFLETELFEIRFFDYAEVGEADFSRFQALVLAWTSKQPILPLLRILRMGAGDVPIVVTGVPRDSQVATSLFRTGVNDVFCDADDLEDLEDNLVFHIENEALHERGRDLDQMLSMEVGVKTRDLEAALSRVQRAYEDTLESLVLALDAREHATGAHSKRVALYCLYLVTRSDIPRERWEAIYRGALLHDIGKIGIPDHILLKPGKLTEEEFETIKSHTLIARSFLENVDFLRDSIGIPLRHHEKWDGAGYPDGMKGEDIPIEARFFAVIDVYDALRAKRSYKEPFTHEKALSIIGEGVGTHFDPDVAALFLRQPQVVWEQLWEKGKEIKPFDAIVEICLAVGAFLSERTDSTPNPNGSTI